MDTAQGGFNLGIDYLCLAEDHDPELTGERFFFSDDAKIYRELIHPNQILDGAYITNVGSGDDIMSETVVRNSPTGGWKLEPVRHSNVGRVVFGIVYSLLATFIMYVLVNRDAAVFGEKWLWSCYISGFRSWCFPLWFVDLCCKRNTYRLAVSRRAQQGADRG